MVENSDKTKGIAGIWNQWGLRYCASIISIIAAVAVLAPIHNQINATTVALTLLLVILFIATVWGSGPAFAASLLGVLGFNFFFLPPVGTFTIADPQNWVALSAFLVTTIVVGQLSSKAKTRAYEAEAGRREIERLYLELQEAFGRASHIEALRQSDQLKSALLDSVTHDLRTPLTSIKAAVTTLLIELSSSKQSLLDDEGRRELLDVINEETDRLNNLVESMVELARIEAGEMHLRRRWSIVEEILADTLRRAEPLLRQHKIKVEIDTEVPAIRVDSLGAVGEVVYTLIDNATKYAPPGIPIIVTASRHDGEMVRITVEDQGRGIDQELRETVFNKFFRDPRTELPVGRRKGIGLGLAIARGIVEAHGGRIWIEDGSGGKGTRVVFTLPIGDEESEMSEIPEHAKIEDRALLSSSGGPEINLRRQ